jgi:hypothetical protein
VRRNHDVPRISKSYGRDWTSNVDARNHGSVSVAQPRGFIRAARYDHRATIARAHGDGGYRAFMAEQRPAAR